MLKALDHLSVRPLEAINLIRNLLKVDAHLIPDVGASGGSDGD
ncbi:transferase with NAD(P)-binding Rossmann-fold domain; UPF0052 family [Escherichia coli]|uniref:Transferase with NAD(P)-binding Rossmann-fold domain UPF0052 family n=1 Tax=Escherichia coli TaxID=562 RepID=A0A377DIU2_ECOLX|nr:transferase with NAD(P)-binding Rossmann-fold domain; UPF0052 family [Escherichia coli]